VVIARGEADRGTAKFFGDLLGMPVEVMPPEESTEGVPLIRIVLGKDYVYKPFVKLFPEPAAPDISVTTSSSSESSASSESSLSSVSSLSSDSSSDSSSSSEPEPQPE
jgi:hypothetical protein